jgi:RNA polymerase sigma-70 factor (ECF subfamily)
VSEPLRLVFAVSGAATSQNLCHYRKADATVAVDRCYVSLYRFALCLTASHSRAADLVRQSFLNFSRWKDQTQDYSRIERCLFTILYRCYLNPDSEVGFADFGICPQTELVPETRDATATDPECLGLPGVPDLPAAVAQVNEAGRAALSLFYLGNFSVRDIAHILELPIDTVMWRLSKGRAQLRSILCR